MNNNFSIVNYLYERKLIKRRAFEIISSIEPDGVFYLEGFPRYVTDKYNYCYSCNMISSEHTSRLNLTKVQVGKYMYDYFDLSYFQNNDKKILVSKRFVKFMKEKYFDSYIRNNICRFRILLKYHFYECIYNQILEFPQISVYFNDKGIIMNSKDIYKIMD